MSDIFISYANQDRPRAEQLARALEQHGWSTFWDRKIPAGRTWREIIGREIEDARSIIVLWSAASIESDWVQAEAEEGRERKNLAPVLIETGVRPPMGFRQIQTADLSQWDGTETPTFLQLVSDIESLIGQPKPDETASRVPAEEVLKEKTQPRQAKKETLPRTSAISRFWVASLGLIAGVGAIIVAVTYSYNTIQRAPVSLEAPPQSTRLQPTSEPEAQPAPDPKAVSKGKVVGYLVATSGLDRLSLTSDDRICGSPSDAELAKTVPDLAKSEIVLLSVAELYTALQAGVCSAVFFSDAGRARSLFPDSTPIQVTSRP